MKNKFIFNKKVKNVVLIYRPGNLDTAKAAKEFALWLIEKKINVFTHPQRKLKLQKQFLPVVRQLSRIDLAIVLGGDGTYLEAVRLLKDHKVPILGINFGSLGFLTETPIEELYASTELTLNGKMEMRPRSMIRIDIKKENQVIFSEHALNDVVIERGARSHLIYMGIFSEKLHVSDVKADGIIISSPTGSTAYNLAAGGPILHPEVEAFVVTPICPHSLTNRPILFPLHHTLVFKLKKGQQKASLTIDGKNSFTITDKYEVTIKQYTKDHYVLRKPSHNYFSLLTKKLKFGERN